MSDHPDADLTDPHGEAEALRKEIARLRREIAEATDPDFIWGALDNVHDADTTLDDYAAAVSRSQRAALAASRAPDPDWTAAARDMLAIWDAWLGGGRPDLKPGADRLMRAGIFAAQAYEDAMASIAPESAAGYLLRTFLVALIDWKDPQLDPLRAVNRVAARRAPDTFAETQPTALRVLPTFTSANATDKAPIAAIRAPDPVVNDGSCQPGDLISRAAAIEALGFAAWMHQGTDAYSQGMDAGARHQAKQDYEAIRALPAAPVAEAATCLHLTADMAARCPTCNPGLSTSLPDTGAEAQPTIGGAELDALVARLRSFDGDGHTRFAGKTICESAADAITALRAQPDWKAMAERLGDAAKFGVDLIEGDSFGSEWKRGCTAFRRIARAALSDLAKMKGETK